MRLPAGYNFYCNTFKWDKGNDMDTNYSVSSNKEMIKTLDGCMTKIIWLEYRRCMRELSTLNLTYPQFHTLRAIYEHGEDCTMGVLADETAQVSATVTGIIDRLVERKLVSRSRHANDRRQVLVRLTSVGREKLNQVLTLQQHHLSHILDNLDVPVRDSFGTTMKQYMQALELVAYQDNGR